VNARSAGTARIEPGHLRGHATLVQINQAFRRRRVDFFEELRTSLLVGFGVALGGVERLFLSRKPNLRTRRQTALKQRLIWAIICFAK
jgi:hypothetical protein